MNSDEKGVESSSTRPSGRTKQRCSAQTAINSHSFLVFFADEGILFFYPRRLVRLLSSYLFLSRLLVPQTCCSFRSLSHIALDASNTIVSVIPVVAKYVSRMHN